MKDIVAGCTGACCGIVTICILNGEAVAALWFGVGAVFGVLGLIAESRSSKQA